MTIPLIAGLLLLSPSASGPGTPIPVPDEKVPVSSPFTLNPYQFYAYREAPWGPTGHRVVGAIAAEHLTEQARRTISRILDPDSPAIAGTWMDQIRSDPQYDHTHDWHWVTIPDGMTYGETEKNPNGDLVRVLERMIAELKTGELEPEREGERLRMVIHLVADIHQPLHVGNGEDQGGNDVHVRWFGESSNLHRVWDSQMIDDTKLSYTELARKINHPAGQQISRWQRSSVREWAHETMQLRDRVYNLPDSRNLGYRYSYDHLETVERQLLKAGVRLAGLLNEIYG